MSSEYGTGCMLVHSTNIVLLLRVTGLHYILQRIPINHIVFPQTISIEICPMFLFVWFSRHYFTSITIVFINRQFSSENSFNNTN